MGLALALASAGAARLDRGAASVQPTGTTVIGPSTLAGGSGNPSWQNLQSCAGATPCTYIQFNASGADPSYAAPVDGTIIGWRIMAGSANAKVALRILRPSGGGKFQAVGTSTTQTTSGSATTPDSFTTNLPVQAGDIIGLDNSSNALLFKTGVTGEIPNYFTPILTDGAAAAAPKAPAGEGSGDQIQIDAYLEPSQPAGTSVIGPSALAPSGNPPFQNLQSCAGTTPCTYLQFNASGADPSYASPVDGTIASWRISAGSAGGKVALRILRPAGGGKFTPVGTSATQTTSGDPAKPDQFQASIPVKAGDIIGLDNSSNALLFKTGVSGEIPNFFTPLLADGSAAAAPRAPTGEGSGYQIQIDAYVVPATATMSTSTTTTTTATSTGTATTTTTTTTTSTTASTTSTGTTGSTTTGGAGNPPVLSRLSVAPHSFKAAVGADLSFQLSGDALVQLAIAHVLPGRRINGRCVEGSKTLSAPVCTINAPAGSTTTSGKAGANHGHLSGTVSGKRLSPGNYRLTATATKAGGTSKPVTATFAILPP